MAKQAYWNLLDALIEHPSFVNCESRDCKRCAKIIELGKEAYKNCFDGFNLGDDIEDLTEEVFQELLDADFTVTEVAQYYGLTTRQFADWRDKKGFKVKARVIISKGQADAIEIMFKQGKTVSEVAQMFRLSYFQVYGSLQKRGVKLSKVEEDVISVRN